MRSNYHTHTYRCNHATGTIEDYVKEAIKANIDEIGISDHLPHPGKNIDNYHRMAYEDLEDYFGKIEEAIEHTDNVIEKTLNWYEENKEELISAKQIACIGYGPGYGVTREADTKITETVRIPMNGHELEEYMHGPYLSLSNKHHIIFIETEGKLEDRQQALRLYLNEYTDHIYKITYKNYKEDIRDLALDISVDELISPLLFVIPIQILSYFLAEDKGNKLSQKIFEDFDDKLKSKI